MLGNHNNIYYDNNKFVLRNIIFGVVGIDIFRPPGGLFLGLIKYKQDRIRPTFLEQTKFSSFQVDTLRNKLILSSKSLIDKSNTNIIKIVDLRPLGCPVYQYAALVKKLKFNDIDLVKFKGPIYGIFDTGSTGCLLSDAIKNDISVPSLIRKVSVTLETLNGEEITLEAKATRDNIFVVSGKNINWFKNNNNTNIFTNVFISDEYHKPQIIVLGIEFFNNKIFTVDIDEGNMLLA